MSPDRKQFPVSTAQQVAIEFDVAGLGDRFVAALIDYLILGAYLFAWTIVSSIAFRGNLHGAFPSSVLIVGILPALVYFPFCELVFDGQTIGKGARGLRVMRTSGEPPSLGDLLLRWLLRPIDLWATSGLAAVATILYTGTGQRLGDLAAGTTVVEQRPRASIDDTMFRDVPDDYTPTFSEAQRLESDDIRIVRRILRQLSEASSPRAQERVQGLATDAKETLLRRMETTSDLDPSSFLQTLLRDYNFFRQR